MQMVHALSNNLNINGVLTFTNGIITTSSADTVIIASAGSVSRTSGHVNGNLQKYFPAGSNVLRLFEIGDATTFAPDTVAFASVTTGGNLISSTTAGEHPQIASSNINPTSDVNRYWTVTNSGIVFTTCNVTFNFVAGDIDAGAITGSFIVGKYDAAWTIPTAGTRTGTSTQAIGITSFHFCRLGIRDWRYKRNPRKFLPIRCDRELECCYDMAAIQWNVLGSGNSSA